MGWADGWVDGFLVGAGLAALVTYLICRWSMDRDVVDALEGFDSTLAKINESHKERMTKPPGWKCGSCGHVNAHDVAACPCVRKHV